MLARTEDVASGILVKSRLRWRRTWRRWKKKREGTRVEGGEGIEERGEE